MEYKMRNLVTNDVYKMSKILKKMGLKLNIEKKTQAQLGAELIFSIMENLYLAQDEVNDFLGNLVGLKADEFGVLPIEDSMNIMTMFKEQPGLASFFNFAGKLTK